MRKEAKNKPNGSEKRDRRPLLTRIPCKPLPTSLTPPQLFLHPRHETPRFQERESERQEDLAAAKETPKKMMSVENGDDGTFGRSVRGKMPRRQNQKIHPFCLFPCPVLILLPLSLPLGGDITKTCVKKKTQKIFPGHAGVHPQNGVIPLYAL